MREIDRVEELYDEIFRRKSVRRYTDAPVPAETINELLDFMSTLEPLSPESGVALRVLSDREVHGPGTQMPHYLACYASGPYAMLETGYLLQCADLWLSARGYGRCWLGMAKTTNEAAAYDGLPFVMMLGFGEPNEAVYRETPGEFDRRPLSEITDVSGRGALLEAVRLAPSIMNAQPWFVSGSDPFTLCLKRANVLEMMIGDLPHVDIGCAACHLLIALWHEGVNPSVSFERRTVPKGCEFVLAVKG